MRFKDNADEIHASLKRRGRAVVYHWTPLVALPSVLRHGLLCRRGLEARGIDYVGHGYGAMGKEADFAGHVCVSFYPQKGMMLRANGSSALIEMSSRIVAAEGAFYCPDNTARSEFDFATASQWTRLEDLDSLFADDNPGWLISWQAEVWIPEGIPVSEFSRVMFRSDLDLQEARRLCAGITLPRPTGLPVLVASGMFPTPVPPPETDDDAEELPF